MTNIAFFGTSDKALPILKALKENFNLVLCVTKHDVIIGRDMKVRETEVKKWARESDVPLVEIGSLKGRDLAVVAEALISHRVGLAIVADFSYIIPNEIISNIKHGMLNVHFSMLPKYRGASPVQHAILHGEKHTGITFQLIASGMDTGDIIYQQEIELDEDDYTLELYEEMFETAGKILPTVIDKYMDKKLLPNKQDESKATYCYSPTNPKSTLVYKEDARIHWQHEDLEHINRKIHAFSHWPTAFTSLKSMEEAQLHINNEGITGRAGKLIFRSKSDRDLGVKIFKSHMSEGTLVVEQIQVEGKNKTDWKSFLNGYLKK